MRYNMCEKQQEEDRIDKLSMLNFKLNEIERKVT